MATLNVRMSDEEYKRIEQKAQQNGLSISEYIRLVALNSTITVKTKEP